MGSPLLELGQEPTELREPHSPRGPRGPLSLHARPYGLYERSEQPCSLRAHPSRTSASLALAQRRNSSARRVLPIPCLTQDGHDARLSRASRLIL